MKYSLTKLVTKYVINFLPFWGLLGTAIFYTLVYNAVIRCQLAFLGCKAIDFSSTVQYLSKIQSTLVANPILTNVESIDPPQSINLLLHYSNHMMWSLIAGLCVFFSLLSFLFSCYVIWISLNKTVSVRFLIIGLAMLGTLCSGGIVSFISSIGHTPEQTHLWEQLVQHSINTDVTGIVQVTRTIDSITYLTAIFLTVSLSLMLSQMPNTQKTNQQLLQKQGGYLKILFYLSVILLIVSTLRLSALLNWSAVYLKPPAFAYSKDTIQQIMYQSIENMISTTVTGQGLFYTLLLMGYCIPAAFLLRQRAFTIVDSKGNDWLKDFPLGGGIPRVLAIISPLLTGSIGQILSLIK